MRGDEKKVIQAKLRRNMSVGNDAVQQVVAKEIYSCLEAVVITNSIFTPKRRNLPVRMASNLLTASCCGCGCRRRWGRVGREAN